MYFEIYQNMLSYTTDLVTIFTNRVIWKCMKMDFRIVCSSLTDYECLCNGIDRS